MSKDIEELFKACKEELIPSLFPLMGIPIDYSKKSLMKMERALHGMVKQGSATAPTFLVPFGFYLGETIVQTIPGAKWNFKGANMSKIAVEIETDEGPADTHSMVLYPFIRIDKFLHDRTDGIVAYYHGVEAMLSKQIDPENLPSGEWVDLGESKIRITRTDK